MMIALGVFLVLHGVAHLVGFAGSFRLLPPDKMAHTTMLFAGRVDVGEAGMRAMGVGWLVAAVGFLVAAVGVFLRADWALTATVVVAAGSLALCLAQLPEAKIGLVIDVLIIGLVIALRLL
jgi:hypothetical protein